MLGIKHIKFDSSYYVLHYSSGRVKREGRGLSFYYYSPNSSIVAVPCGSDDVQFIFNEVTADYQTISIQGQITYQVMNPKQLAELLDFTVDDDGLYKKDNSEKLSQRLINEAQTATSSFIKSIEIKSAIGSAKLIEEKIIEGLSVSKAVELLGIKPISVNIIAVRPDPSMAKALEAKTRETLQKEADLSIYERRNFAVEQERVIKESELNTEIAVEEKKKQIMLKKSESDVLKEQNDRKIREMRIDADTSVAKKRMEGDISDAEHQRKLKEMHMQTDLIIEEQKKKLVEIQSENEKISAEAKGFVISTTLKPFKDIDWRTLLALQPGKNDAAQNISLAFRELANNAQKIGNLNISPDLLETIMQHSNNQV